MFYYSAHVCTGGKGQNQDWNPCGLEPVLLITMHTILFSLCFVLLAVMEKKIRHIIMETLPKSNSKNLNHMHTILHILKKMKAYSFNNNLLQTKPIKENFQSRNSDAKKDILVKKQREVKQWDEEGISLLA